jgi:hypothetical protein
MEEGRTQAPIQTEEVHVSHLIEGVDDELLSCLNSWPEGTVGHQNEKAVIAVLNLLCKQHGYGRIPQLCAQIEQVWREPKMAERFRKAREKRLEQMAKDKEWLKAHESTGT